MMTLLPKADTPVDMKALREQIERSFVGDQSGALKVLDEHGRETWASRRRRMVGWCRRIARGGRVICWGVYEARRVCPQTHE
jgi:hypothetical protein